ncbi:hypothetical protein PTTG_28002 [Puccinia triticina 1-1 BBBD Race 1]|uniref:Uncharacterized protein n=1 Tax=Puccinia triticina (isolate 1-1 / race 1 (BBBD)) TaxID=630390 RepID=A0A180GF50_PUCT1|nr:hypothetical protein PTTG_28002 [Puccinia triticina 1-1 BBBD Race 1]
MAEISPPSNSSVTNSAQQPRSGFKELKLALPPLGEDFLSFPQEEPLPPDTGIPLALYNPRETSLALASNRSTPVPRPVEREPMNLAGSQPTSLPTNPEGLKPEAPPDLALLPPIQNPQAVDSSGPMEFIPEDPELTGLVNLFNNQFDLFVQAWEAQNWRSVRMFLTQAATMQDMIKEIAGRDKTIRLYTNYEPQNTAAPPSQSNQSLAIAPHPHHQPMMAIPTPEPASFQHRTQGAEYQGHTPQYDQGFQPPPPPPAQTQSRNQAHNVSTLVPPPPPPPPHPHQQVTRLPASTPLDGSQVTRHTPFNALANITSHIHPNIKQQEHHMRIRSATILLKTGEDWGGIGGVRGTTLKESSK